MPIFQSMSLDFRDQKDDILYAGEIKQLKFRTQTFTEDRDISKWTVDVIPVRTYRKYYLFYQRDQETVYYIGQSHEGRKSVFIFEKSIDKNSVELFAHITNLSILDSSTRIADEGEWEDFTFPTLSSTAQLSLN